MLQIIKLLLPALIPSWRFFDTIAASPRIEVVLLKTPQDTTGNWQEFRPRPAHLSIGAMLIRLFWNPRWNESLFLVSCAERLMANPTAHSSQEILKRIKAELERNPIEALAKPYLQFRLAFLSRQDNKIEKQVTYISPPYRYAGNGTS